MCGRYTLTKTEEYLEMFFGVLNAFEYTPRYNAAPGQEHPVVRLAANSAKAQPQREWVKLKWGLVPKWAKADSFKTPGGFINAKSETVHEKPTFRDAAQHRRCLVPADGFIEWETIGGKKQPHWFHLAEDQPFAFAGIWEPPAKGLNGDQPTFAVLTVPANEDVSPVHDRMPAILLPDQFANWLDTDAKWDDLASLLQPLPKESLVSHSVSALINSPKNDHPDLLKPVQTSLFS